MTPYELNLMVENYNNNIKEQRKADISTAFYSAYFARIKELSGQDLQKVLDKIDNPVDDEMSDEAMLKVLKRLAGG